MASTLRTVPLLVASVALMFGFHHAPFPSVAVGASGLSAPAAPDVPAPLPSCSEDGSYFCNQYDPDWDCIEDGIWFQNACNDEDPECDGSGSEEPLQ